MIKCKWKAEETMRKGHKGEEDVESYNHPRTDVKGEIEIEVETSFRCEIA